MQTSFERLGITYRQEGDYLLPNIEAPESPQIGIWGQRRLQYLRTNKRVLYTTMLIGDTLKVHLEEVNKSADEMFEHSFNAKLWSKSLSTQKNIKLELGIFNSIKF